MRGGFDGLSTPGMPEQVPEIVVVVGRRPGGMTEQTARLLNHFAEQAQFRDAFCNSTAQHEQYLRAEYAERDITPWDSSIVDFAVSVGIGFIPGVGPALGIGLGLNQAIADRYRDDADAVRQLRYEYGCPPR